MNIGPLEYCKKKKIPNLKNISYIGLYKKFLFRRLLCNVENCNDSLNI